MIFGPPSVKNIGSIVDGGTRSNSGIRASIDVAKARFGQLRTILVNLRTYLVSFAFWMLGLDDQQKNDKKA